VRDWVVFMRLTGDPEYIRTSYIPLASLMRNVFFWESDMGYAHAYRTFAGRILMQAALIILPQWEQHQIWYSLREYLRQTKQALSQESQTLVAEFLRYAPATIWYAYPAHLSPDALFVEKPSGKTDSNYSLQIPVEDVNIGWHKNGSVGRKYTERRGFHYRLADL